ncbi:hexokinase-2-like protein [Perkinsela sp. CCAP 1560/4]|nr:hexokinase-2-like protein [Perkinsela sp. CCAP 1560/4]|eukprot:KNH04834.1 hexokinase-2-like protein [Perkinsela sp. CCAP 1560/4]
MRPSMSSMISRPKFAVNFHKKSFPSLAYNARRAFSTANTGNVALIDGIRKASAELKNQSIDLRDMCAAARIPKQTLEASLSNDLGTKSSDVKSIVSSLKAYCVRVSALQGEAESVCSEMQELISSLDRADREAEPIATEKAAPTVAEISENEVEIEEPASTSAQNISSGVSVQEMTEYLHAKSIDFSDCFDEESLGKRYIAVKKGTYVPPRKESSVAPIAPKVPSDSHKVCAIREPPTYERDSSSGSKHSQEKMNYGGSSQNAVMQDPYPGAERRMCDPMKYVWEVKQEICQGKGVNSSQVDIWCGPIKLEDHRRMYEYPQCQRTPMEVRMSGDTRINKNLN